MIWAAKLNLFGQTESSRTDATEDFGICTLKVDRVTCNDLLDGLLMTTWKAYMSAPTQSFRGVFLGCHTHGTWKRPIPIWMTNVSIYNSKALTLDELFTHLTCHRSHHGLRLQVTLKEKRKAYA